MVVSGWPVASCKSPNWEIHKSACDIRHRLVPLTGGMISPWSQVETFTSAFKKLGPNFESVWEQCRTDIETRTQKTKQLKHNF